MSYALAFVRSLSSEALKTRRTLAVWSTLLAPLFVVALTFVVGLRRFRDVETYAGNPWVEYTADMYTFSTLLLLPLYIALLTYLLNALEHRSNAWKYLYVQPIPKSAVFYSKALFGLLLFTLCMAFLGALTAVSGYLLEIFRPQVPFSAWHFWEPLGRITANIYLGCLAVFSFQYVASALFKSFFVPISIAVLGTFAAGMVIGWKHMDKVFFAYPAMAMFEIRGVSFPEAGNYLLYGAVQAVLFIAVGEYFIRRRRAL